jgi:hypothetical protein
VKATANANTGILRGAQDDQGFELRWGNDEEPGNMPGSSRALVCVIPSSV